MAGDPKGATLSVGVLLFTVLLVMQAEETTSTASNFFRLSV